MCWVCKEEGADGDSALREFTFFWVIDLTAMTTVNTYEGYKKAKNNGPRNSERR